MSGEPPRTTLALILAGLPPEEHPVNQATTRLEQALDRLEEQLRRHGLDLPPRKDGTR